MQWRNSSDRFGVVAQIFHWTIVVLIIVQFVLAEQAEELPTGLEKLATLARHKSVGITILALALLRLFWRWTNPTPALPPAMKPWERVLARGTHFGLYALLILQPLTGWLMSSAKAYSVSWFGIFTLPNLVAKDERLFEALQETHEFLAGTIATLAVIHALAALKHHFVNRDDVLRRMLPLQSRASD